MTPGGARVEIEHQLHLTMIDGKVIGALAETGSATSNICAATLSIMNDLGAVTSRPTIQNQCPKLHLTTCNPICNMNLKIIDDVTYDVS